MATALDRPPEEAAEDTSFARGLRVFLTIADRGEIRADELGTLLDTPLSTIYRYLRTLTDFGFVDRHDGGYRLGPRLLIGGGATVSSEELIRRADPVLEMLADETGETSVISRRLGLGAVCLHQHQSGHALRVALEPGVADPLEIGAIGHVLLAFAPPEVQDEVLSSVANPEALEAELATAAPALAARYEQTVAEARKVAEAEADGRWSSLLDTQKAQSREELQAARSLTT